PQRYPDKRLTLDVRHVTRWRGNARGREGQALLWVPPRKLASYRMPPADRPVVAALQQPGRYLATPGGVVSEQAWLDALERTLATGVGRIQLRPPTGDAPRWEALAGAAVR